MADKQSIPLTEDELKSVYRNDLFLIDAPRYYNHRCTGYDQKMKKAIGKKKSFVDKWREKCR